MIREDVPHFVYRAYDADGALLYVGCTYEVEQRMQAHRFQAIPSSWYHQVDRVDVVDYPTRSAARAAESEAIRTEHPIHNQLHRVYEPLGPDACGCLCHGPGLVVWHSRKDCCSAPNRPGPKDAA